MGEDKIIIYGFEFDVSKVFEYMSAEVLDTLNSKQKKAIEDAVLSALNYYKNLEEEKELND